MAMSDEDTHWPTMGDHLFEEVHFLRGARITDDTRERLWRLVNGYKEGADQLVAFSLSGLHLGRNLVYPIIYLYRHSFELAMKIFLMEHGQEAGEKAEFQSHRLDKLWVKCQKVIEYSYPNGLEGGEIYVVEGIVAEFTLADKKSFAYRYAHNVDGSDIEIKESSISLERLGKAMEGIHNFFDCMHTDIHERANISAPDLTGC